MTKVKKIAWPVRIEKTGPAERASTANQIQGFRIPDRKDASEKKDIYDKRLPKGICCNVLYRTEALPIGNGY